MKNPLHKIVTLGFLLVQTSCHDDHGSIEIEIKAKTIDGQPVSDATITLDGQEIGQTNAFGTFSSKENVKASQRHKISVAKTDGNYYYAPHFEIFKVEPSEVKHLVLTPTMYTVPKPHEKRRKKPEQEAENPGAQIAQTPTVEPDHENLDHYGPPLFIINRDDFSEQPKTQQNSPSLEFIFTTHVYAGRLPLGGAKVTWISGDSTESHCTTNDRGRCVIRAHVSSAGQGSILIQNEGFKSYLTTIQPRENGNFRFALEPGRTIDIRTIEVSPWSSHPLTEVEIRSMGKPVGQSNINGLALVPLQENSPVTLTISSKKNRISYDIIVNEKSDTQITARFSDNAKTGWNRWIRYATHVTKEELSNVSLLNFDQIENTISHTVKLEREKTSIHRFPELAGDTLALLPVLRHEGDALEVGFLAITNDGPIAVSEFVLIDSQTQSNAWNTAVEKASKSLMAALPWRGIIANVKGREATALINTGNLKVNDTVVIHGPSGEITSKVIRANNTEATIGIPSNVEISEGKIWTLVGAKFTKTFERKAKISTKSNLKIADLTPAQGDAPSIRLAKKYLAEGNSTEAHRALTLEKDDRESKLATYQMQALIENSLHNRSEVIKSLHRLMAACLEIGLEKAGLMTEANIIMNQVEGMPSIIGDINVANRFKELAQRAESLKNELSTKDQNQALDTALTYTHLVALQKEAESREDFVSLATMTGSWSEFERTISDLANVLPDAESWKNYVRLKKNKVAFKETKDKSSM